MKEIIADLTYLDSEGGDILADHGIVQQLEGVLLDYAGKIIRIKITEITSHKTIKICNRD